MVIWFTYSYKLLLIVAFSILVMPIVNRDYLKLVLLYVNGT